MRFFKRPHILRRYSEEEYVDGYAFIPYEDYVFPMDIQTTEGRINTNPEGRDTVQRLKVFCDTEILTESPGQKADRIYFQNKWFDCLTCRLSENTPLRHWTATFVECLKQESPPEIDLTKGHYDYATGVWIDESRTSEEPDISDGEEVLPEDDMGGADNEQTGTSIPDNIGEESEEELSQL